MNNLKTIREIYGATQEEIASAINVNRVTVANWEAGKGIPSNSNQEKLSLYYGIGPEFFFREELTDVAKQLLVNTSERARDVVARSEGKRNKAEEYHRMFESLTFSKALQRYMHSMKMLLATADSSELKELETAYLINTKMGYRLQAIITLRKEEEKSEEPTLYDLLEQIEKEQ